MNPQRIAAVGVGIFSLAQLVFITLKLLGIISWSLIWVLSPVWIGVSLPIFLILLGLFLILIAKQLTPRPLH